MCNVIRDRGYLRLLSLLQLELLIFALSRITHFITKLLSSEVLQPFFDKKKSEYQSE